MAQLTCKTRGGCNPQGLPRVYFSCHPQDLDTYFERISQEILEKQNCAIYYDTQLDQPFDREQLLSDLNQMQLFVMPVTARLLRSRSRALEVEFAFAMEEHIPVLPLMQEPGLEQLFDEKCGDLQFLDKNLQDETAISYEEKLEKYLSSVLVGDELAAKIRGAFDAYVFLSYRKKDRRYAQELMRLIHKNEFCRDIAIWYDEFLTPGENFNSAISDALNKSHLFALAVTPNLVRETNYVMTTEYPMARQAGKPILPMEMVPTNRRELTEKYTGIPPCADAHNTAELAAALTAGLRNVAIRENDQDPQHNFFIGLAYLAGVDVEVDRDKSLALIEGAADGGLPEAIKKLVEMYRNGEGVARDYEKGITWQKKLVAVLEKICAENKTDENCMAVLSALWDLGDYQYELRHLPEAESTYDRLLNLSSNGWYASDMKAGPRYRRYVAMAYSKLGTIFWAESKLQKAKNYYQKALEHRQDLAQRRKTTAAYKDLVNSLNSLGHIARDEGNLREARAYYQQARDELEKIIREKDKQPFRAELSDCYINLGDIAKAERKPAEAKTYYLQSLEISRQLAAEAETAAARGILLISYERLGDIARAEGKLAEAKNYYLQDLEISKQLAVETETVKARRDLSVSYNKLGDVANAEGKLAEAETYFRQGLAIRRKLAAKPAQQRLILIC